MDTQNTAIVKKEGIRMNRFIPLSVPNLSGKEAEYVQHAVETEWVSTAGPYVNDFEKSIAQYVHVEGAVSCQSGTAGLHTSMLVCGVTAQDMVIVPTLTFIAAVNPVRYIGAEPVFVDCDDSLCLDPDKVEQFCREECELRDQKLYHKQTGRHVSAMIVVHVFGNMADMVRFLDIAERYHLILIEDATEALGTKYTEGPLAGKYAGTMGDMGVYSFNGNKIITTGGGGMIVSVDPRKLAHAKHLTTQAKSDEQNFMHDEIGYNYRLTNLQAALGLAQMEQLESFIEVKTRNYEFYREGIEKIEHAKLLGYRPGVRSNHWFYSLYCEDGLKVGRDEIIEGLKKEGIQTRPVWGLIHQQKPYAGALTYRIEKALDAWKRIVNIPCSSNLTQEDAARVLDCLNALLTK